VLLTEKARFLEDGGEGRGGYLVLPASAHPATTALFAPGLGLEHFLVMKAYDRLASAGVLLHDETKGTVRPSLVFGASRPRIRYWPSAEEARELSRGAFELARLWFAAGAETVILPFARAPLVRSPLQLEDLERRQFPFRPHEVTISSVHPQGSVPMGSDEETSAVAPNGALRGADGVYVADASLFPTSLGVPPQITTAALATHVAYEVAKRVGS
jgi:choline dehydrogenase-like flavoprotein